MFAKWIALTMIGNEWKKQNIFQMRPLLLNCRPGRFVLNELWLVRAEKLLPSLLSPKCLLGSFGRVGALVRLLARLLATVLPP